MIVVIEITRMMMVMIAQVMIEDAEWLMGIFVSQSMFHASAFDRRIVQPLDDLPFKVFRMVVKPNTVICVVRQEMAFEILNAVHRRFQSCTRHWEVRGPPVHLLARAPACLEKRCPRQRDGE